MGNLIMQIKTYKHFKVNLFTGDTIFFTILVENSSYPWMGLYTIISGTIIMDITLVCSEDGVL